MDEINRCIAEASQFLKREIGVCDEQGRVIAGTMPEAGTFNFLDAAKKLAASEDVVAAEGRLFKLINPDSVRDGIAFVSGTDSAAEEVIALLTRWLRSSSMERNTDVERQTFLKNVLLENELPGDIPLKAREYKVVYSQCRQAMLIRFSEPCDSGSQQYIQSLMKNGEDNVLAVDEYNVVVLIACAENDANRTEVLAAQILEHFKREGRQIHIGIGLTTNNLKDTAKSYREASLALTVGGIFQEERFVMWYNKLGLGRLIYQLPPTLCQMFLSEVFAPDTYEALDPETLLTIEKFFENNLNGSETSRQLFVHRNTLVYRLDKVQKITGLDLRSFDDAVLFKLASMVRQYLESLQLNGDPKGLGKRW